MYSYSVLTYCEALMETTDLRLFSQSLATMDLTWNNVCLCMCVCVLETCVYCRAHCSLCANVSTSCRTSSLVTATRTSPCSLLLIAGINAPPPRVCVHLFVLSVNCWALMWPQTLTCTKYFPTGGLELDCQVWCTTSLCLLRSCSITSIGLTGAVVQLATTVQLAAANS